MRQTPQSGRGGGSEAKRRGGAWIDAGGGSPGGGGDDGDGGNRDSYAVNYGTAVRVLREDLPQMLARPLQWDIYREDICFITPWVAPLRGMRHYQMVHRVMRALARLLYRTASVELLRLWSPISSEPFRGGPGGGSCSGSSHRTGTVSNRRQRQGGQTSESDSERGGPEEGNGGGGSGGGGGDGGGERQGGGGQVRVRWRATGQPWLPWSEEQRLEVVATYRFDRRGAITMHELTTVIPPEPPLLLWPLLVVAQLLGRIKGRAGAERGGVPIPVAGAGMGAGPGAAAGAGQVPGVREGGDGGRVEPGAGGAGVC
ncbi:hypothetical protein PLESTM_001477100 [Pleodorina starrii]|nr:hypothetical protein PLESTM_001477100 [Pleodorina starrii]